MTLPKKFIIKMEWSIGFALGLMGRCGYGNLALMN